MAAATMPTFGLQTATQPTHSSFSRSPYPPILPHHLLKPQWPQQYQHQTCETQSTENVVDKETFVSTTPEKLEKVHTTPKRSVIFECENMTCIGNSSCTNQAGITDHRQHPQSTQKQQLLLVQNTFSSMSLYNSHVSKQEQTNHVLNTIAGASLKDGLQACRIRTQETDLESKAGKKTSTDLLKSSSPTQQSLQEEKTRALYSQSPETASRPTFGFLHTFTSTPMPPPNLTLPSMNSYSNVEDTRSNEDRTPSIQNDLNMQLQAPSPSPSSRRRCIFSERCWNQSTSLLGSTSRKERRSLSHSDAIEAMQRMSHLGGKSDGIQDRSLHTPPLSTVVVFPNSPPPPSMLGFPKCAPSLYLKQQLLMRHHHTDRKRAVSFHCSNNSKESFVEPFWLPTSNDKNSNGSNIRPNYTTVPKALNHHLNNDRRLHGVARQELHEFTQPYDCTYRRDHLKRLDDFPNLDWTLPLPTLPSPLQRLRKHSGVYPLMSPQSILRRPLKVQTQSHQGAKMNVPHADESKLEYGDVCNTNRCIDLCRKPALVMDDRCGSTLSTSSSRTSPTSFCSSEHTGSTETTKTGHVLGLGSNRGGTTRVKFDPRVTVTEFEEPFCGSGRQWYSDQELESFKYQTLQRVKQYLMLYPEAFIEYNTPVLDPITGRLRRKAMFSLPVLGCPSPSIDENHSDFDDNDGFPSPIIKTTEKSYFNSNKNDNIRADLNTRTDSSKTSNKNKDTISVRGDRCTTTHLQDYRRNMSKLAIQEVRSILIIDPNQLVLDLFKRSLQIIFPQATFVTAKSAAEAFRLIFPKTTQPENPQQRNCCNFDIVIVEERLCSVIDRSPAIGASSKKSIPNRILTNDNIAITTPLSNVVTRSPIRYFKMNSFQGDKFVKSPDDLESFICNVQSGSEFIQKLIQVNLHQDQTSSKTKMECKSSEKGLPNDIFPLHTTTSEYTEKKNNGSCLFIGVTTDPCNDTKVFLDCGADVVWRKPPPCMSECMRNHLVTLLLEKRQKEV